MACGTLSDAENKNNMHTHLPSNVERWPVAAGQSTVLCALARYCHTGTSVTLLGP